MEFNLSPTREALRAFISTMVVNQDLVTDELVEERYADATAPGAREAMISMGMSFFNRGQRRGRHALARGAQDPQAHAAHLGPRGPGQPAGRRDGRAQGDPAGHPARVPELRALGTDRGRRRVRRGGHELPGAALEHQGESGHDDRHQVHGLRPRGLAPTSTQWTTFAGKVLGLAEGRGPNPEHQYWRIDQVSARLVVFPSDVDQLDCVGWELADHARPAGGARAPREGRRRLRGGHSRRSSTSAGCRS